MDVEKFLTEAGVKFEKHEHPVAYTAQEVAAEEHVTGDAVAKSVIIKAGQKDVLCVLPASFKVDLGKVAQIMQVDDCQLEDEPGLGKLFPDVELGAEPPFGQLYGLDTLVDQHLQRCRTITFNAGTHRSAIRISYEDFARLTRPKVADFSMHL